MDDEDLSPEEIEALSQAMGDGDEAEETAAEETLMQDDAMESNTMESNTMEEDLLKEAVGPEQAGAGSNISHAQFTQIEPSDDGDFEPQAVERMYDVKVKVEVLLGSCKMQLQEILNLHPGSVVELNKLAGEPVDILANGKLIARAEVVVIEENFGIKIIEISGTRQKFDAIAS